MAYQRMLAFGAVVALATVIGQDLSATLPAP
jgi:hypothetical protein